MGILDAQRGHSSSTAVEQALKMSPANNEGSLKTASCLCVKGCCRQGGLSVNRTMLSSCQPASGTDYLKIDRKVCLDF